MEVALAVAVGVLAAVAVLLALRLRTESAQAAKVIGLRRAASDAAARAVAAEASADHLRTALDVVPQGVVVLDADGRAVARNRAAEDLASGRHGDALARSVVDELGTSAVQGLGGTRTVDLFGPPARVLEIVARPLARGALVVVDDITEARQIDAVRRDFVANLSHELKTPVGAIGLLAETLLAEPDGEVSQRLTERIVSESFRVSRTIDDLLELSRIEAEGADATRGEVAVGPVLEEAADRIRPAADARSIGIRVAEVGPDVVALGDARQLVSAVANLLDNAVKYSSPSTGVDVRATTDGATVAIEVEDRGLGIPARDLERVFERFYRVDRARSRETGGTGLGLAIVRHVVANHEGEVSVRSTEGQGSTFTIQVPAGPDPRRKP